MDLSGKTGRYFVLLAAWWVRYRGRCDTLLPHRALITTSIPRERLIYLLNASCTVIVFSAMVAACVVRNVRSWRGSEWFMLSRVLQKVFQIVYNLLIIFRFFNKIHTFHHVWVTWMPLAKPTLMVIPFKIKSGCLIFYCWIVSFWNFTGWFTPTPL